jgi:formate dehydrogenase subunit delta
MMETRDMVRMANQIAAFFKGYGHDEAVKGTADHINHFWEPRMRRALLAHLDKGGDGLDQVVRDAAPDIARPRPEAA